MKLKHFLFWFQMTAAVANLLSGMYLIKHGFSPVKAFAFAGFWIFLAYIKALEIGPRKP